VVTPADDSPAESTCLCGCGGQPGRRSRPGQQSRFLAGHDRFAETAVVRMRYGSVEAFLARHGYGPGGDNLREAVSRWEQETAQHPARELVRRLGATREQIAGKPVDVVELVLAGREDHESGGGSSRRR